jgi:hypothetical protein
MDTHRTPAYEYLTQHRTKDAGYTHTCLTGGTFCVQGDDADRLDDLLAKAIRHDRPGEPSLPCLTQRRTMVFPLYLDLDLKLPERALADDLVRRLAATLATAVMRFWPDADDPAAFECVVCTRTGDAAQDDGGLYKHGLHVHWHNVLVDDNMARQVREGLLLDVRHDARLAALNAAHPVKWEDVLDASVYGPKGSLRLLGCPKATKCRSCGGRANESCGVCYRSNGCHLIDPRVYALRTALRGADECAEYLAQLRANAAMLVRHTSVRARQSAAQPLRGFRVYPGCPEPAAGGKRRGAALSNGLVKTPKLGAEFRGREEVADATTARIARRLLCALSGMYASVAHVKVSRCSYRGNVSYFVDLFGDNANYCVNKRDHHPGNRAYMIIEPPKKGVSTYSAHMRCHCRCEKPRPSGDYCRDVKGQLSCPRVALEQDEVDHLFPSARRAGPAASSSSASLFAPLSAMTTDALERELSALEARAR